MSALKHGLFRAGFMLCDRCSINAKCEHFIGDSCCIIEKQAFEHLVNELTKHYKLDMVADRILVERASMYLIKICRVEAYEAMSGVTQKSVILGGYISRLDNNLRGFLSDLAVSRLKRKGLEKTRQLMLNIEDILESLANKQVQKEVIAPVGKERRTAHGGSGGFSYAPIGYTSTVTVQVPSPFAPLYHNLLTSWRKEAQKLQKKLENKQK